jgi:type IV pilus assembly protein PilB
MGRIFGFKTKDQPAGLSTIHEFCNGDDEINGLSNLYSPEQDSEVHIRDVADVLAESGKINQEQLSELRQLQQQSEGDISRLIMERKMAGEVDLLSARAGLHGCEFRKIEPDQVEKEAFHKLELDYIKNNRVLPLNIQDGTLVVATSHPGEVFVIEDVKRQTGMNVRAVVCTEDDIDKICQVMDTTKMDSSLDEIISDMTDVEIVQDQEVLSEDLEKTAGQAPVIKFVNFLISNAVRDGASDIHIEPKEQTMRTRYRIDGVLFDVKQSSMKMHPAIVSRVKIMANLDISERRLPQDGKIKVSVGGRAIDLRVSTLPTHYGEKVVIRVLDSRSILRGLEQLGMEQSIQASFAEQVDMPHGIMLVTGPTGSGKSTTLYSALAKMDGDKLNISTVEDPVEYELGFCNQVQVSEKIGLDFSTSLRALLRQDPDVIMIGEIRDNETARIAVQAALTGHLVLSTLHTNDAASSVSRLVDIGIDPYLLAASLNAILAQRLVRKICPKCKQLYKVSDYMRGHIEKAGINPDELYHGAGCENCRNSGYVGRVGIYEMLVVNEQFREMIHKDPSINNMRKAFRQSGGKSLFENGLIKIKQAITTIEEVLRVTEVQNESNGEGS